MPRLFCTTPAEQLSEMQLLERAQCFANLHNVAFALLVVSGIGTAASLAAKTMTLGWVCLSVVLASTFGQCYSACRREIDTRELRSRSLTMTV